MKKQCAVEINDLTVRFGDRTVVDRFSLTLAHGTRMSLTGKSGSGKSTILKAVAGLVVPDAGSVKIEGEPITCASVSRLRTRLAYVPQDPDPGPGTLREILEQPFGFHANAGLTYSSDDTLAHFDRFLLRASLLDDDFSTLSGGEKQRAAIISALLLGRSIFLLDEITSALDSDCKRAVADYFAREPDLSVISVSHDPEGVYFPECNVVLSPTDDPGGAPWIQ